MSSHKLRALTLGAPVAFALAGAPAYATQINIGVAADFTNTLNAIISEFVLYYPTYTFSVISDSTGNLKDAIDDSNPPPYDLFLAADDTTPEGLPAAKKYGAPFHYAIGSLELYSGPNALWNISAGLPNRPFTHPIVIANPTKAPYGYAAAYILQQKPWNIANLTTASNGNPADGVYTRSNIAITYAAVQAGTFYAGFVSKSAICQYYSGADHFPANTYHFEYVWDSLTTPHYPEIIQDGVILTRSKAGEAAAKTFVNFLTTNKSALAIISRYCFQLPSTL